MICSNCGKEIDDNTNFCPNCGYRIVRIYQTDFEPQPVPSGNATLYAVLSFFFPLVGIILFAIWRKSRPEVARKVIIGTTIALILYLMLIMIFVAMFI